VITIIEGLSDHSTRLLFKIHQILLSSLRSRHESILNKSIGMWNRTFGCVEALEYPEDMRKALLRLRFMTDIQTPTFPEAEKDEVSFTVFLIQGVRTLTSHRRRLHRSASFVHRIAKQSYIVSRQ